MRPKKITSRYLRSNFIIEFVVSIVAGLSAVIWSVLFSSESVMTDWRFRMRAALSRTPQADTRIVIVEVPENVLQRHGSAGGERTTPRDYLARLVDRLALARPQVIALDYLFEQPTAADPELQRAIREAGNVVIASRSIPAIRGSRINETDTLQAFRKAACGMGFANVGTDEPGGAIRWHDFVRNNEPSLAAAVLRCHFRDRLSPARPDYSRPPQLTPAERDFFIRQGIPETAFHAPLLLNYPGPLHHYFNIFSCQDLLEMPSDAFLAFFADKLAGRIVIVGDSGYRSADIHRTPFTPGGAPPDTFGVLLQATALRSLLDRSFITVSGTAADIAILLAVVLAALLIAFHCSFIRASLFLLAEILLYFAAAFFLFFQWHILIPVVVMSGAIFITGLVTILLRIAISEKDNIDARQVLAGTIPPAIIDACAAQSEESIFKSRKAELVILACWPRHIPDISERNTPEKVTVFLNQYYRLLREAIFANAGVFNRFAFSGVLAFWNAPVPDREAVSRALTAARQISGRLALINQERERLFPASQPVELDIALHRGEALVGYLGAGGNSEYTAIGESIDRTALLAKSLSGDAESWVVASAAFRQGLPENWFATENAGSDDLEIRRVCFAALDATPAG